MGLNNETEKNYIDMVKENYELLIKAGIDKENLDKVISEEERNYPNMDNKIVENLFFIETLKSFGLFGEKELVQRDGRLGGGFYSDGYIYGYDITYDSEKYRIILDNQYITDTRECLEFGKTDDIEILKQQKEMLEKFRGFSNSQTISRQLKIVEEKLQLLQSKDHVASKEVAEESELDKKVGPQVDEQGEISDDKKIESLDTIQDEWKRCQIIKSLTSDDKKIELLDTIDKVWHKTEIIVSLTSDDKKIGLLDTIKDDRYKMDVIKSLTSDDKKIELLDTIDEAWHDRIIESLSKERLEAEFDYSFGKGWQRKEKKTEVKESFEEAPELNEPIAPEVDEQGTLEVDETQIGLGDIAKLDMQSEITSTELAPIQEKGIKAFIRKMINKIKGIGE